MTAVVGTFVNFFYDIEHWMAPEVYEGNQYTLKADVYSYGVIFKSIW